jgi:predicted methyltransferase
MGATFRRSLGGSALAVLALTIAAGQTREGESNREGWQHLDEIFKAMQIGPGSKAADLGAGDGFLTVRLAPRVGENGRVYAEDIDKKRLAGLRARLAEEHLANVDIIEGEPNDPHLPAGLDAVVIVNAYHEMHGWEEMLGHIHEALKPGGRLVIAEPSPSSDQDSRAEQMKKHRITASLVAEDMLRAGFTVIEKREKFAHITGGDIDYSIVVGQRDSNRQ